MDGKGPLPFPYRLSSSVPSLPLPLHPPRKGRKGKREGRSGRGRWGRESGGRARLGYLSRGPEFLVTPLYVVLSIRL